MTDMSDEMLLVMLYVRNEGARKLEMMMARNYDRWIAVGRDIPWPAFEEETLTDLTIMILKFKSFWGSISVVSPDFDDKLSLAKGMADMINRRLGKR